MTTRYCIACGNGLAEGGAFCSNCGRPVHETARVSTSDANVQVPPYPQPQQAAAYHQQTTGSGSGGRKVRSGYYWLTFAVLSILALVAGDNGTAVAVIGVIIATVWVSRDAKSRGMHNPETWAAGVLLLFIVFFPLYFFKRPPRI